MANVKFRLTKRAKKADVFQYTSLFKGIGKHRSASIAPPRYARNVVKTKNPMCKAKLVGRKSRYLSVVAKKINEKS